MPIGKIGQRRQVVIPKEIFEALGLKTGDFVEVTQVKRTVVIKPKKLVDADDVLTPEEEAIVRKGEQQLRQGKSQPWSQIKHALARGTFGGSRSPAQALSPQYPGANRAGN